MAYVARTKENLERCKCMDCPSYTLGCKLKSMPENIYKMMKDLDTTEHFEGMFCAFEKSHCIEEDRGCLCSSCDIYHQYQLDRREFCLSDGGLCAVQNITKDKNIHPIYQA